MKFTDLFKNWIDGNKTPVAEREKSALLTEARSTILDITQRIDSGEIKVADQADIAAAHYEKVRPKKQPIFNRQPQAPSPAKPSTPAAKPAAPTAHAVQQAQLLAKAILDETAKREAAAKIRTRAQFRKMTPREANEFFRNGGKLAD